MMRATQLFSRGMLVLAVLAAVLALAGAVAWAADAPATVVKKIANTEKIISELRSVSRLTRPSFRTSTCTPNLVDLDDM